MQKAGLDIEVTNTAINQLPADADIVVTHQNLTDRAKAKLPNAYHVSVENFLNSPKYDELIEKLKTKCLKHETQGNGAPLRFALRFHVCIRYWHTTLSPVQVSLIAVGVGNSQREKYNLKLKTVNNNNDENENISSLSNQEKKPLQ
ncbi:PTS system mannitol-specific EIICB component [Geobacillus sp. BCO2]|nr:PTS system mannitol-specific EIICB component [Geobacillus sp. BCO2]